MVSAHSVQEAGVSTGEDSSLSKQLTEIFVPVCPVKKKTGFFKGD